VVIYPLLDDGVVKGDGEYYSQKPVLCANVHRRPQQRSLAILEAEIFVCCFLEKGSY